MRRLPATVLHSHICRVACSQISFTAPRCHHRACWRSMNTQHKHAMSDQPAPPHAMARQRRRRGALNVHRPPSGNIERAHNSGHLGDLEERGFWIFGNGIRSVDFAALPRGLCGAAFPCGLVRRGSSSRRRARAPRGALSRSQLLCRAHAAGGRVWWRCRLCGSARPKVCTHGRSVCCGT